MTWEASFCKKIKRDYLQGNHDDGHTTTTIKTRTNGGAQESRQIIQCTTISAPQHHNKVGGEETKDSGETCLYFHPGCGLSPSRAQANPRPCWWLRFQFWEAWAVESWAKARVCRPSWACTTLVKIDTSLKRPSLKLAAKLINSTNGTTHLLWMIWTTRTSSGHYYYWP